MRTVTMLDFNLSNNFSDFNNQLCANYVTETIKANNLIRADWISFSIGFLLLAMGIMIFIKKYVPYFCRRFPQFKTWWELHQTQYENYSWIIFYGIFYGFFYAWIFFLSPISGYLRFFGWLF